MPTVALVSVTPSAATPMSAYLKERDPALKIVNYLDGYLMERVRKDGGITEGSLRRMEYMLGLACDDGADAVLLTCTAFSKYAGRFSNRFPRPVICPDRAMLAQVAACGGRTAILCTFSGTVQTTARLYEECCQAADARPDYEMVLIDEAAAAAARGDQAAHDAFIAERARELDDSFDTVVFAQISMAHAADGLALRHARLYTSPQSAYGALREALGA